jgi:hypothetical protein
VTHRARNRLHAAGLIAFVVVLVAVAAQVQAVREQLYPASDAAEDSLYLTSGDALRRLTVSLNALAADVYWIRAIQYYGGTHRRLELEPARPLPPAAIAWAADYDQLYPLLDLTTSADPRFTIAYRFGAVFLAEPYPGGADRPELAIALLEKGLREQPDKWQYMEDIGFVHYWYRSDFRSAAKWFDLAASVPGGPWWLKSLAAATLARGGDRKSSRLMWEAIRESAQIDWLRKDAERRLFQLRSLDEIDALNAIVDRFTSGTGESASNWVRLVRAGAIRGIPVDPLGTPYELSEDGHVQLSRTSPLWPLPDEPMRTAPPPS